jgi:hypothetical protein
MSLLSNLSKIARGPQGQKVLAGAQKLAKDPATRQKIDEARRKIAGRGKGGGGTGGTTGGPTPA